MVLTFLKRLYLKILTYRSRGFIPFPTNPKILCLRYDRIGDMVVTLPLIQALKHSMPTAQIDVLASSSNAPIAEWDDSINRTIIKKTKFSALVCQLFSLRRQRYDILIDLNHGVAKHALYKIHMIRPLNVLSPFKYGKHGLKGTEMPIFNMMAPESPIHHDHRHITDIYFDILPVIGIERPAKDLSARYRIKPLGSSTLNSKPFIIFNHAGSREDNSLSREQAIDLLKALITLDVKIKWCCAPNFSQHAFTIFNGLGRPRSIEIVSPQNILGATAMIHNSSLVVTPDTAITHIACAFDKPLVAFFGGSQVHNKQWSPLSDAKKLIFEAPNKNLRSLNTEKLLPDFVRFCRATIRK